MNLGKCPHCEKVITNVNVDDVSVDVGIKPRWRGFSYYCPSCKKVLSVQINPLTVEDDIVGQTTVRIKKLLTTLQDEIERKIAEAVRKLQR